MEPRTESGHGRRGCGGRFMQPHRLGRATVLRYSHTNLGAAGKVFCGRHYSL